MTSLAARVLRSVRNRRLVARGDRIVAAVSGGADSVALVHLLLEIAASLEASVVGVAHLNHGLRGEDADKDQAFVSSLADSLHLPLFASSEDVGAIARERGVSIEQAGHEARRAFYASVLATSGASRLATGHTADDQAETVLLRLIRGTGTRGLGGIHPRRARLIRPLIDTTRAEVRRYLGRRGLSWREDASNDDPAIARNRVRLELMPILRDRFSPAVARTLARAADVLRDDDSYLEDAATQAAVSVVLEDVSGLSLDRARLTSLHPALARRVLRHALRALGRGGIGARHVEQVLAMASAHTRGASLSLTGVSVSVADHRLVLRQAGTGRVRAVGGAVPRLTPVPLAIPGDTDVPALGVRISAMWLAREAADGVRGSETTPDVVVLDPAAARLGLCVRTWKPGDRVRPAGLAGRKKLQDLFVDRKVARADRGRVPVVVDGDDAVVWVVGHAVSDAARARENASSVLLLMVKDPGGIG